MKINENYIYRSIAGEQILVPVGCADKHNGMFVLTEIGGQIWLSLKDGKTEKEIIDKLYEEYDVSYEELKNDVQKYIKKLVDNGIVTEN